MADTYLETEYVDLTDDMIEALPDDTEEAGIKLPDNYSLNGKGLWYVPDGDKGPSWLSGPFRILGHARDQSGAGWSIGLSFRDKDGCEHVHFVPNRELIGDGIDVLRPLADEGLSVSPHSSQLKRLKAFLIELDCSARVRIVSRIGWHEQRERQIFVLPDGAVGDAADEKTMLQSTSSARNPFGSRGTLEDWQKDVARHCEGNSRLAFSVSVALAGPLPGLLGLNDGGGFHLYGPSSQGKTTALQVAASVWGKGDKSGFVSTWRGTANGMEGIAAMHTDTVLILDEIGQADSKTVAEASYMLAQGVGKTRATRTGEARKAAQWRILVLSSGELTTSAKIGEDKSRKIAAGQMVRLIDIPSDAGKGLGAFDVTPRGFQSVKDLADHLKEATAQSYGTAGPALIEAIMTDPDSCRQAVFAFMADWKAEHSPNGADSQVRRAVDRFALVAAAGEFATATGLVPWQTGAASQAAAQMLGDWITARGGVDQSETSAGIAQVRRFIEAFGESRFAVLGDTMDERIIPNRAGFRRGYDAEREWLILPETWRSEIAAGHDATLLAKAMAERGMLKVGGDGKPQVKTHIPNMGKVRVYILTDALFQEG
jgi:uncharacterized protein (DUF927 family)